MEHAESGEIEVVYLLGADEIDTSKLENTFVIYQGHHGDKGHMWQMLSCLVLHIQKNMQLM